MGYRAKPNKGDKYSQGKYNLLNPPKYLGDPTCIYFRSSWEYKLYFFLDNNPRVLKWNVEGVTIPYEIMENQKWTTNRYYPDAYCEILKLDGSISKVVIEIKPWNEYSPGSKKGTETENTPLLPPIPPQSKTLKALENYEYKLKTFQKNILKWKAAKNFCDKKGLEFYVLTERAFNETGVKLF